MKTRTKVEWDRKNLEDSTNITISWIDFNKTTFSRSGLLEVIDFLKVGDDAIFASWCINVYYLWMSDFMAEFRTESEMNDYLEQLSNTWVKANKWMQIPTFRWSFSYDWKYYALLWAEYDFQNSEDNTPYWYKSIIFDIVSYKWISWAIKDGKSATRKFF